MASRCAIRAEFFIEYFALDLIMEDGACRGVMALVAWKTARVHRFRAHRTILATGGYGRAYFSATSAHTCTGDGNAMVLRAGLPLQDMEFVQFHPTGSLWRRRPHHRGRARRGRLSHQFGRRALHGALCAFRQGPRLARCRLALDDASRFAKAAASGPTRTISISISSISIPMFSKSACPASRESAKIFAGVDVTREPIPILPTVHYNMGGIPTNYQGEALAGDPQDPEKIVPGLLPSAKRPASRCMAPTGSAPIR